MLSTCSHIIKHKSQKIFYKSKGNSNRDSDENSGEEEEYSLQLMKDLEILQSKNLSINQNFVNRKRN